MRVVIGDRAPTRRFKVLGILRDALRQKSMGIIEEIPEKGITKYAKPAGVVCALIPTTNPVNTPMGIAIYAIKCKDAVIFGPHPSSKKSTNEAVRLMRKALRKAGAPEDLLQCVAAAEHPDGAGIDVHLRFDGCHGRRADGEGCLQLRQAGLWRGSWKLDHGDR